MTTIQVTQIGNSLGVIFNKETLKMLGADKGTRLLVTEDTNGIKLSTYDPELEEQLELMKNISKRDKDVFRILAKK